MISMAELSATSHTDTTHSNMYTNSSTTENTMTEETPAATTTVQTTTAAKTIDILTAALKEKTPSDTTTTSSAVKPTLLKQQKDEIGKLTVVQQVHQVIAVVAHKIGCSVIIISCSLIVIIFLVLRDFSHERCLHMSQELCLICSHLLILSFWDKYDNKYLCQITNKGSLLFMVALFVFIGFESLHSYSISTNVVRRGAWHSRFRCQLIAWSTAICSVIPTIFLTMDYNWSCWVNYDQPFWALGFAVIISASITTAVLTEATGMDMRKPIFGYDRFQRNAALSNSVGMITLLPLQTASIFVGSLSMFHYSKNNVFYLSEIGCVINTILAVKLFIFHCMGNPKAHELILKLWAKLLCKGKKPTGPRFIYYP